jgi:hypothetical protein
LSASIAQLLDCSILLERCCAWTKWHGWWEIDKSPLLTFWHPRHSCFAATNNTLVPEQYQLTHLIGVQIMAHAFFCCCTTCRVQQCSASHPAPKAAHARPYPGRQASHLKECEVELKRVQVVCRYSTVLTVLDAVGFVRSSNRDSRVGGGERRRKREKDRRRERESERDGQTERQTERQRERIDGVERESMSYLLSLCLFVSAMNTLPSFNPAVQMHRQSITSQQ